MSIIQTIRDKGAKISVALIALALIGFILTDYLSGKGRGLFSGSGSNGVGSVNGKSISYEAIRKKADQVEANFKQQGYPSNPAMTQEAVNQAWNGEVNRLLLRSEFEKLGMRIGKKERGDLLYGANAPDFIKKAGTDDKTGQYNPLKAKQQVDQMMKDRKTPQAQKDEFNNYIDELDEYRKSEKYNSLFANSVNYPRWLVEKQTNDKAQIAKIGMVKMLYTDSVLGPDSAIKISDKEIEDYLNKRKDQFKQEKSRSISYVSFSAAPTNADTLEAKNRLAETKAEFDTTQDVANFVGRNGNLAPLDNYYSPAQLPPAGKDSIMKLAKNAVMGPYREGGSYVMIKMIDTKVLPDSVKCRHILLGTVDRSGQPIMDDSLAHHLADSIALAIKNGANFDTLETKFTTDQAAHNDKGVMTFSSDQIQGEGFAPEFGQFILFDGKPGDKKVVKTQFGWHYIEILSFIKPETHYKIALVAADIHPSQQTDNDAIQKANEFFGAVKDPKNFDEVYDKTAKAQGATKAIAASIRELDAQVGGQGGAPLVSRSFVMNVYKAKLGEILKPEKIGSDYVVAVVTEVNEEGRQSVAKARPGVELELRKRKKAEMIKQKIGSVTTLEDVAAKLGKAIEIADSVRMDVNSFTKELGNEPKVKGAAFNPANKGKVAGPIAGENGVYVIRVENISATSSGQASVEEQRKTKYQMGKQQAGGPIEALKKIANIKDKRSERF